MPRQGRDYRNIFHDPMSGHILKMCPDIGSKTTIQRLNSIVANLAGRTEQLRFFSKTPDDNSTLPILRSALCADLRMGKVDVRTRFSKLGFAMKGKLEAKKAKTAIRAKKV
jgi:hypothetical protein